MPFGSEVLGQNGLAERSLRLSAPRQDSVLSHLFPAVRWEVVAVPMVCEEERSTM